MPFVLDKPLEPSFLGFVLVLTGVIYQWVIKPLLKNMATEKKA